MVTKRPLTRARIIGAGVGVSGKQPRLFGVRAVWRTNFFLARDLTGFKSMANKLAGCWQNKTAMSLTANDVVS